MANINGAFGLRPLKQLGQSANTTGATEYRIAYDNSNVLYRGQAVIPTAAGVIDDLQAAAGGNVSIVGVFWGVNMFLAQQVKLPGVIIGLDLERIVTTQ